MSGVTWAAKRAQPSVTNTLRSACRWLTYSRSTSTVSNKPCPAIALAHVSCWTQPHTILAWAQMGASSTGSPVSPPGPTSEGREPCSKEGRVLLCCTWCTVGLS